MFATPYLIIGSYLSAALGIVKAILFLYAAIFVRPKSLEKMSWVKRCRLTLIKEKNEENLFSSTEYKKLKLGRVLWRTIFLLLILRVLIGFVLINLDYEISSKCTHSKPCEAKGQK